MGYSLEVTIIAASGDFRPGEATVLVGDFYNSYVPNRITGETVSSFAVFVGLTT